jgi:YihY family inner membrane protein
VDVVGAVRWVDRAQQRWPWLAYPYAVTKKFSDDQAGNLAALLAYYSFVSVLPLLLVFVTLLGLVLRDYPALRDQLLRSALVEFPVIGDQLRLRGLQGNWWVLVVAIGFSLWGALGVARAAQTAFNSVWNVPYARRPGFLPGVLRSLGLLLSLGVAVLVTGSLSGLGGAATVSAPVRVAALALSALINVSVFIVAFRLATAREVATRDLVPGAVVSALLWQVLLASGSALVAHQVRYAQSLYGAFGVVLGLLAWLHLQAQLTLYAVEADVVRARRLWPRSAVQPPLTQADRRAYRAYAQREQRRPDAEQQIDVRFEHNTQATDDQPRE